jgi:hypothetical protein
LLILMAVVARHCFSAEVFRQHLRRRIIAGEKFVGVAFTLRRMLQRSYHECNLTILLFSHPNDVVFFLEENANKLLDLPIGFDGVDNPARVDMADSEGG